MNNFDVKFETRYSNDKKTRKSFILTLTQKENDLAYGYYAIYPSADHTELVITPKHKFDEMEKRFSELAGTITMAEQEKEHAIKIKNRKHYISAEEINEAKMLRGIITNSILFCISSPEVTISLPSKFLDILRIKGDTITFIQTGLNEYIAVNPDKAWKYSDSNVFNNQEYETDNSAKAIFGRFKRAM